MNQVEIKGEIVECDICGAGFYVSAGQQLRSNQMGVEVRHRCPLCRKEGHRTKRTHYQSRFNEVDFNRVMQAAKAEIELWRRLDKT